MDSPSRYPFIIAHSLKKPPPANLRAARLGDRTLRGAAMTFAAPPRRDHRKRQRFEMLIPYLLRQPPHEAIPHSPASVRWYIRSLDLRERLLPIRPLRPHLL